MATKVSKINLQTLEFEDGTILFAEHEQDCCESHYLSLKDLMMYDFDELEFDLEDENSIIKIEGYGIALNPIKGFPVRIPAYGSNNGYYSSELTLFLKKEEKIIKEIDISKCQDIQWE